MLLAVECDRFAGEGNAHVVHVHVVAARLEGDHVGGPPHTRDAVVAADGMHEALQHAVVVLGPEADELPQRLLVEVSEDAA